MSDGWRIFYSICVIVCVIVAPLLTFLALCCCGAWTTPRGERCVCYPVKYRPCSRRRAAGSGLGLLAAAVVFVLLLYFSTGCGGSDLDCGEHGRCANILGLVAAPYCACADGYGGTFCEYPPIDLSTVPAQCVAGMGSHGVVYNGAAYRTLDDAPPEGGDWGDPGHGCQCEDSHCTSADDRSWQGNNYLPLPPGYALAPPDADTIAVIAAHGWSTRCAVTADGEAWASANYGSTVAGDDCAVNSGPWYCNSCGHRILARSGGSHTVTSCWRAGRVLARCPRP